MDDLLTDFLTETKESLVALDAALVRLEQTPRDAPTLSEVFRQVHTIKGTCGFLGLSRLERVTHAAENLLGRWREGSLVVTPFGISAVLAALDAVRAIVAGLESDGAEPAGDDAGTIATLDRIHQGAAAEQAPPPATVTVDGMPAPVAATQGQAAAQTIRVSVDVLEDLMMLVSELVLTRNQLMQLARAQADGALTVALQRLSLITSELQDGVMKTRMQPIANAWAKLPRLVRDLGHDLGKRIELRMRGEDTELDRQVLELIKDPLTHMVRNSADHGLEDPAARKAAGKTEGGTISLNAYHEGGQIVLEVGDDGRGLNTARIKAKAVAQGLATEAEVAQLSERDIHRFIFRAGFSTAAAVTAVSGRGVGMDVVKTNVERIGGTVDVRSREGAGTTFTIHIPLTLAIVSGLIVEAGGERFAIPQIGVLELVSVGGGRDDAPVLEWIKDVPVLRLRDQLLPVVSLARMLALIPAEQATTPAGFVVVMRVGGHVFGVLVDRVFDTEEIVVKPVAPILRSLTMFSGNTILGDGSVIMILDPNGIARAAGLGAESGGDGAAEVAPGAAQRSTERTALLLFRMGEGGPKAVPLGLISRLEEIPTERIEHAGAAAIVQYRGQIMPLIAMDGGALPHCDGPRQPVLVFNEGDSFMGLAVDEILDVVEERLDLSATTVSPGFLGSAVIGGKVTEVLDAGYWLRRAGADWFHRRPRRGAEPKRRILVVEDSGFFRSLIVPAIAAAGFEVTAVENGARALALREQGAAFDLLVSDIEMPELDGLGFARQVRQGGAWRDVPMIALSSLAEPDHIERGRAAGFTDYVRKYDRESLIASIRDCLAAPDIATAEVGHDVRG